MYLYSNEEHVKEMKIKLKCTVYSDTQLCTCMYSCSQNEKKEKYCSGLLPIIIIIVIVAF